MRSNVAIGWFFLCKVTDNCKILTFSPRKIIDSTLTQAISSWLNSDSNDYQRDSTLTRLISLIFTADSTLTRLTWVRVESNLTHDSWVEHNPGGRPPLGEILAWKESLTLTCTYYEHETYTGSSFFSIYRDFGNAAIDSPESVVENQKTMLFTFDLTLTMYVIFLRKI